MSSRRQRIKGLYESGHTYEQVGGRVGLTKQRVEQIIREFNEVDELRHEIGKLAERYNNPDLRDKEKIVDTIRTSSMKKEAKERLNITSDYAFDRLLELHDIDFDDEFYIELKCADPECDKGENGKRKIVKRKRVKHEQGEYGEGPFCSDECRENYRRTIRFDENGKLPNKTEELVKNRWTKTEDGEEVEYLEFECVNPNCTKGPDGQRGTITMTKSEFEKRDYEVGPPCSNSCKAYFFNNYNPDD